MRVFSTVATLQSEIAKARKEGKTIGLVPTMGALHEGHLSLLRIAKQQCDIVVASVFVNPIQFNNPDDLKTYPRTLEADCEKLLSVDCDIVFNPTEQEMYPAPVTDTYHFGILEDVMEGPNRPGHFSGVAIVVRRLFDIVSPDKAFFGEKDFQQLAIIRRLVEQLQLSVQIISCPIVRTADGLALSSRNMRLSPEARAMAPKIYATLTAAVEKSQCRSIEDTKQEVIDTLLSYNVFKPEYFEIVNDTTLQPVSHWEDAKGIVGCITVWMDDVRLIDMIRFR